MCGIAGILHHSGRPVDRDVLAAMTATLVHRGPDAQGLFVDNHVGLGHRRLSIIDLDTGDQPLASEDGSLVVVFNGEIYNYLELRQELESAGARFRTASDTEVILQAYARWGTACQERFNGMWAFAIWDSQQRTLFLSRDRCGEKPLFYSEYNGSLYFASEAKALFAAGVPDDRNLGLLQIYLTLGYIPAPYSFFRHISKLQSGHSILVRDSKVTVSKYWAMPQVPEQEMRTDRSSVEAEFAELFSDSVRIRMRCDVPFGAFLSGGMDSACVVALMSDYSDYPVETFTIGFDFKDYDERQIAQTIADKYATNHHVYTIERDEFDHALMMTLHHYDEPFGDSSAIPTGFVSASAATRVKMVLTGDGGDEVLSGYNSYVGEKIAGYYQRLPGPVRNGIPVLVEGLGALAGGNLRYKANRLAGFLSASALPFERRLVSKAAWAPMDILHNMLADCKNQYPVIDYINDVFGQCEFTDPYYRLMYFQFSVSLPERMLTKVDRMSMAHSLETRVPFLDYRLVELMCKTSKHVKTPGVTRKAVLKDAFGHRLTDAILSAPKKGFRVPLREWFKDDVFSTTGLFAGGRAACLDNKAISDVVESNRTGKRDYGNFIWMLCLLDRWLEMS